MSPKDIQSYDHVFEYRPFEHFKPAHKLLSSASTRVLVLLCARRIGKTWFGMSAIVTGALHRPGNYAVIYPLQQTGKKVAWPILRQLLQGIPGVDFRRGDLEIEVPCMGGGKSLIGIYGGADDDTGSGVRGMEFTGIFVDEIAQIGIDAFWGAIFPTINNVENPWIIASGTPRGADLLGELFDQAEEGTEEGWHAVHIPATKAPQVYTPEKIEMLRRTMPSQKFEREIMANKNVSDELAMIPLEHVIACQSRTVPEAVMKTLVRSNSIIMGVDVGLSRDESVICLRIGPLLYDYWRIKEPTAPELATKILSLIREHDVDMCFIDNGSAGAAVIDILISLGVSPIRINFGGKPDSTERYANKRAEMYDRAAEWCEKVNSVLPEDDQYVAKQLSASRYFMSTSNKLQIEPKEQVRKRLGRSPDFADAFALTFSVHQTGEYNPRLNLPPPHLIGVAASNRRGSEDALIEIGADGSRYTSPERTRRHKEKYKASIADEWTEAHQKAWDAEWEEYWEEDYGS
ncbi:MAG: hypothetical protein AAF583_08120 [Pseudomonadota bacterium]